MAQLWPVLLDRLGLEISFAHRPFIWDSDARGKAHVHVVIVGLTRAAAAPNRKRLFSYEANDHEPHESEHSAITPYLFDGGSLANTHLVVREASRPLNGLPQLISGSQPIDDGNYIFTESERNEFLRLEPGAKEFLRPYVGSKEHINGSMRWILALQEASPSQLRALPMVRERMAAVREFRASSKRVRTLAIASYPERFNVEVLPREPFLIIPETSSERREYIPIGWMEPPTIPSNLVRIIPNASRPLFALLTSAMHMSWMRHIGGRLESRYRYSIGSVYNTFPLPPDGLGALDSLAEDAESVLAARAAFPNECLATLYDPDLMPTRLRKAHQELDRKVDRMYRRSGFSSDRERVEFLFGLYESVVAPMAMLAGQGRHPRRRN